MDDFGTDFNKGYDSAKGEYVDMIAAGIVDPSRLSELDWLMLPVLPRY
jgi:chaperonin GroEL